MIKLNYLKDFLSSKTTWGISLILNLQNHSTTILARYFCKYAYGKTWDQKDSKRIVGTILHDSWIVLKMAENHLKSVIYTIYKKTSKCEQAHSEHVCDPKRWFMESDACN